MPYNPTKPKPFFLKNIIQSRQKWIEQDERERLKLLIIIVFFIIPVVFIVAHQP